MNYKNIDIGELIKQKLKEENRSVAWLAKKINKDPSNLHKTLKKKSMDTDLLGRISEALNYNFSDYYKDNS